MAKSNRRRKLDRAKRQARDTQQQVAAGRRQEYRQEVKAAAEQLKRLENPDSPVTETAELLGKVYGGRPVNVFAVSRMMDSGWSMERLSEVADAMLASGAAGEGEPSLASLTFAAQVAQATGDPRRASELLDRAVAIAEAVAEADDDSYIRLRLLAHMRGIGRRAEATSLLEASLRDDPDDHFTVELYGVAVSEAYEQATGQQAADDCACRSGIAWEECCGPRERAVLSRFADRSGLTALTDAVNDFLSRSESGGSESGGSESGGSEYGRAVDREIARHLTAVEDVKFEPAELDSFRSLIAEVALVTASPEPQDRDEDADDLLAIQAFAADPSVPAELAARARAWQEHFRYGLWKVESEPAAPGLWCTDICTGEMRYVDFPAHFTDSWPRWSVWLGGIVPVDGIWRATGTGLRLSPAEADAAAEFVETAVDDVVNSLAGKKGSGRRADDPMRIGTAEPYGVLVEEQDPMPPLVGSVTMMTMAQLMWRIFLEVHIHRRAKRLAGRERRGEGWEKSWIDQPLAVLQGRSPRQTSMGEYQPRVEALLRQFEYEADELGAPGQSEAAVDWLRQELDMITLPLDD